MDLNQLQAMGAVAPAALVKKDIAIRRPPMLPKEQWADPNTPEADESAPLDQWSEDTLTVHIRKRSSVDFYELMRAEDRIKPFVVIHRCICDAKGQPVFQDLAQAIALKEWLWMPLAFAANEVNEFGPKKLQAEDEFWCELALALGGRSIAEWQQAISEEERSVWIAYRNKRGGLNPILRTDASLARISAQINNALGGQLKPADFMPWANDENEEASVSDVMNMLIGGKRG